MSTKRIALILLFAVSFGVYFNSIPSQFVLDDPAAVQGHPGAKWPLNLEAIFTTNYWGDRENFEDLSIYRPLATLTFALTDGLGGSDCPGCHRTVNLLLHFACAWMVFLLGAALFRRESVALVAALVFAVHPIHTEAVVGIVSRAELLAALFVLLGTWGYLKWVRGVDKVVWWARPAIAGLYLLAMLSKENGATFWGILWAFVIADAIAWVWEHRNLKGWRTDLWIHLPLAVVLGGYFLLRSQVLSHTLSWQVHFADNPMMGGDAVTRWLTPFKVFGSYLKLLVVPYPLVIDYSYDHFQVVTSLADWEAWAGLAAFLFLAVGALYAARRRPNLGALVLAGFASYVVVSHLLFLSTIIFAERLMYLPSAFFVLGLAFLADEGWELSGATTLKRIVAVGVGVVIVVYGGITVVRNADWATSLTLYASAAEVAPGSARNQSLYANALFNSGHVKQAIPHYRNSLSISPTNFVARTNLARALAMTGDLKSAEGEALMALEFKKGYPSALLVLANVVAASHREEESLPLFAAYLRVRPKDMTAHINYAAALLAAKRYEDVLSALEAAHRANPDFRPPLPMVCEVLANIGKPASVEGLCRQHGLLKP